MGDKPRRFIDEALHQRRPPASSVGTMSPEETYVHQLFRRMHCARKDEPDHTCVGKMTIDCGGVLLQCELCGASRLRNAATERPPGIQEE